MKIRLKKGEALALRTCRKDGTAYNDFVWPKNGFVKAPDWDRTLVCGNGLHGALHGIGAGRLFYKSPGALWQIVKVKTNNLCKLGDDKVKFPNCVVVFTGTKKEATDIMLENGYIFSIGATSISSNNHQPAVSTDFGESFCKKSDSIAISGNSGLCVVNDNSSVIVLDNAKVIAKNKCNIIAGTGCDIIAGLHCRVFCGEGTKISAGYGTIVVVKSRLYGYFSDVNSNMYLGSRLDIDACYRVGNAIFVSES